MSALLNNANENFENRFNDCNDKFNRIFELTSAASKIINSDLRIVKVNKALTELLGYSEEEIEGTKILDYACAEYKHHWHDLQEALWKRKLPFFKLDACLYRKDRSVAWVRVTTILFQDQNETFGFTVLDDITYRKNFEEKEKQLKAALADSEKTQQDLARVLETMAEGVGIVDLDGQLTYANKMAQNILGLKESEIKERTYDDPKWTNIRVDGSPLPPDEHPMAIMKRTKQQVFDHEIGVKPTDGEVFYISINAAPIFNDQGELTGGLGTFMDVSHRRRITQQKDDFISVASHELKTPLTSLTGAIQMLDRMKDDPSSKMLPHFISQANRSLKKVNTLVGDLLNASRFREGELPLKKTVFNMAELIDDCCENIRLEGKYTILTTGALAASVNADRDRLEQVISNFVNNAIKYAPGSKDIIILIEEIQNLLKISITDKGEGIPKDKQQQLFNRYYQVNASDKQYSGLGLGLYINAEIIRRHGGDVGVISSPGEGSTFWFTLPHESITA